MELTKLTEICRKNGYFDEFSHDLVCMYPFMIKKYGYDAIDKLLTEWKFKFINNIGASGYCERDRKEIYINLYNSDFFHLYRVITGTIHEVGHALGTLDFNSNSFLDDGKTFNQDFFTKMDEAVVSDYQNDLLVGELEYNYTDEKPYNFKCRGDYAHYDTAYPIENYYFNVFKILLGKDTYLIDKMMYDSNINNKKNYFEKIIHILKSKLSDTQFNELVNSCAILIYNHSYYSLWCNNLFEERKSSEKKLLFDWNYDYIKNGELTEEDVEEYYNQRYSKVSKIISEQNLFSVRISKQCDKLSEMTLDYLINGLTEMQTFDFDLIKSACSYFTKINNVNPNLKSKNQQLKELLKLQLLDFTILLSENISSKFNIDEMLTILIKLISLNEMSFDKLNELKILLPNEQTNFIYCTDGESIIKIGRYSDLEKDPFKKHHDSSLGNVYLDIVIPEIQLSKGLMFGDKAIKGNCVVTDKLLCDTSQIKHRHGK